MKIMVFDVAAECGGAVTILEQYYEKALKDKKNQYYFIVSKASLKNQGNIRIVRYTWVKRSWIHRFLFEECVASRLIKRYNIDQVISLQNIIVKHTNVKQTLYLHQPLPFIEKKYTIVENVKFWLYQNIISKLIMQSIQDANEVIVQTEWMKQACLERVKVEANKIKIEQPNIIVGKNQKLYQKQGEQVLFFYPASAFPYKNHQIIVDACQQLNRKYKNKFKIIFTITGRENKSSKQLYRKVKQLNLPIKFIGSISKEEVYNYYSKSILIFASYVETFGLPMLEARKCETPIIASDCNFSHEILDGYDKVEFFNPFEVRELVKRLSELL